MALLTLFGLSSFLLMVNRPSLMVRGHLAEEYDKFNRLLSPFLIERVSGTENNVKVQNVSERLSIESNLNQRYDHF